MNVGELIIIVVTCTVVFNEDYTPNKDISYYAGSTHVTYFRPGINPRWPFNKCKKMKEIKPVQGQRDATAARKILPGREIAMYGNDD